MKKENGILSEVGKIDITLLKSQPEKFWEGVDTIGSGAFENSGVVELVIPPTIKSLKPRALGNCKHLTTVAIPESVTKITPYTFKWCWSLKKVLLPDTITDIEDYAFAGCEKLENIFIPDGVKSIGPYAFAHCHNLQKLVIPSSVEKVGFGAFYCDMKLKEVTALGNTKFHNETFVGTNGNVKLTTICTEVEMA